MKANVLLGSREQLDHLRLREPNRFLVKLNVKLDCAIGRLIKKDVGCRLHDVGYFSEAKNEVPQLSQKLILCIFCIKVKTGNRVHFRAHLPVL